MTEACFGGFDAPTSVKDDGYRSHEPRFGRMSEGQDPKILAL